MPKKLSTVKKHMVKEAVRDAFAYRRAVSGRDSVIFRGETYFEEAELRRVVERLLQEGEKFPNLRNSP